MQVLASALRASGVALVAAILASFGIAARAAPTSPPADALEAVTYCYGLHPYCFELDAVLEFRPSGLVFPAQMPSAASAAQTVTLVNISDRPLYLSRFQITGPFAFATTCPLVTFASGFTSPSLPVGASCTFDVTFGPAAVGGHTGTLRISDYWLASIGFYELPLSGTSGLAVGNATGLWANIDEAGWGVNFSHQGDTIFASIFTYGSDGQAMWLFASGMTRQADGAFSGDLYRASAGPPFFQERWAPITMAREGSIMLALNDDGGATLIYNVGADRVVKTLHPYVFGPAPPTCNAGAVSRANATNYQDLWWNPAEPGWGVNLAHQGNVIFSSLFTYGEDGRNKWYFASGMALQPDGSFFGRLYAATGPPFFSFPWGAYAARDVGTMVLRFADGEHGTLTYAVDNRTVVKQIMRYVFGATTPVCQ